MFLTRLSELLFVDMLATVVIYFAIFAIILKQLRYHPWFITFAWLWLYSRLSLIDRFQRVFGRHHVAENQRASDMKMLLSCN